MDKFNLLKREERKEQIERRVTDGERETVLKIARSCPKTRFATVRRRMKGCQVADGGPIQGPNSAKMTIANSI